MTAVHHAESAVPSTWLTPRPSRAAPVHRWFVFPHSYGPQLVEWVLDRLSLHAGSVVLDPFCGAGTTLVECQRRGLRSIGVDLLPLAALAARAKTNPPRKRALRDTSRRSVEAARKADPIPPRPPVLDRALSPEAYGRLAAALATAGNGPAGDSVRIATLSITRRFSSLVADGGWLRKSPAELPPDLVPEELAQALSTISEDLNGKPHPPATVLRGDSRSLPLEDGSVDAVITSPPYPNRHDYTRVFAVELELGFGIADGVWALRRQAIHSHPEARPERPDRHYEPLPELDDKVAEVAAQHPDGRIPDMLAGYFRDLHDVLIELRRVLTPDGHAAFVVGNARYCGVSIPVDDYLAGIAARIGFVVEAACPLRFRGNSAQQMGAYGREASRESLVHLRCA